MKILSLSELDLLVASLNERRGSLLQKVAVFDREVSLGFYYRGQAWWIWVDLDTQRPLILMMGDQAPPRRPKKNTPLGLFLKAHAVGLPLSSARRLAEWGRVLQITLGGDEAFIEMEIRLFPHGQNFLVRTGEKSMAWKKPRALQSLAEVHVDEKPPRTWDELLDEWKELHAKGKLQGSKESSSKDDASRQKERMLKKLQRRRTKIEQDLEDKKKKPWREVAQWIQQNQSLQVPQGWQDYVDLAEGLHWNVERGFQKAKDLEAKIHRTEANLQEVIDQEKALRSGQASSVRPSDSKSVNLLSQAGAKGRQLPLGQGLVAYVGKSASDNLALLRRARAWDLWLHLKDSPGAYGIVHRQKNQSVSDSLLRKVAHWLLERDLGSKAKHRQGDHFEFLVAEARYVRPIKGDRLGRVTYQNERVLPVKL